MYSSLHGQSVSDASDWTSSPLEAPVITSDITRFWHAFDLAMEQPGNPFDSGYLRNGSPGVQHFLAHNRIVNADTLLATVRRRKQDYLAIRTRTLQIHKTEKSIRAAYFAFKYLYPQAVFPPVYFVIGRFTTGGTSNEAGQIIGAEMNSLAAIPPTVAHELIHANQHIPYKYRILLEQCIIEGSADFLGELISGKIASTEAYSYAKGREKWLWEDFKKDMNLGENDSFSNWLYGGTRKDDRPADMGYYIGYAITKAYYDKAPDKMKAVDDILHITDCRAFLQASGYDALVENSRDTSKAPGHETDMQSVTFTCSRCAAKNRFMVSGPKHEMLKNQRFPITLKLPLGQYKMKYIEHGVQQIDLPFAVDGEKNTIRVK
jgi:hypothetical protein